MNRLSLFLLVSLLSITARTRCFAQDAKDVWSNVDQWSGLATSSTFGTLEAYACYDIDHDGVAEAVVRGDDMGTKNYLVLAYNSANFEVIATSELKDGFGIYVDAPVVFAYKDNCDGTEYLQQVKVQQSRVEGAYVLATITNDDQVTYRYRCVRNGKPVEGFDKQQYEAALPTFDTSKVVNLDQLEWVKIN